MSDHTFKFVVSGTLSDTQKERISNAIATAVTQVLASEPAGTSRAATLTAQRFNVLLPNGGWLGPIDILRNTSLVDAAKGHGIEGVTTKAG